MKKLLIDFVRVLSIKYIFLLLIIGLFVIGFYFRKDIMVSYHKWGQESALNSISIPSTKEKYDIEAAKLKKHREALIKLGYLEKRIFKTKYLTAFSPEMRKINSEFNKRHPHCLYSFDVIGGYNIEIICPANVMSTWEELIKKNDVSADPNNSLTNEKQGNI